MDERQTDEHKMGKKEKGIDAGIDLEKHHGGPTDPTGHVSSGLQGGPLREKGGRPVADNDEPEPPSTRTRDLEEENVTQEQLRKGDKRQEEEAERKDRVDHAW